MSKQHVDYWTYLPDRESTYDLGYALGQTILASSPPLRLIAAYGNLGAGKTSLAQGLARGVGVPKTVYVNSPTYALHQVHHIPSQNSVKHFHHLDLYRLADEDDLIHLGLDEAIESGVSFVEWPQRAPQFFASHQHINIHLFHLDEWSNGDLSSYTDGRILMLNGQKVIIESLLDTLPLSFTQKSDPSLLTSTQ